MSTAQLDCPEGVQTFQFEFKLWVCGYTCVRRWKPNQKHSTCIMSHNFCATRGKQIQELNIIGATMMANGSHEAIPVVCLAPGDNGFCIVMRCA